MENIDLAIIGAGPAGLSAAIYGTRGCLKTIVFEKGIVGGQIVLTPDIENYPGFEETMSGYDLMDKMRLQAIRFGTEFRDEEILKIDIDNNEKYLHSSVNTYKVKSLIVATGCSPRKLGVSGETKLTGMGVSYCAICDGALFNDKVIAMVGGGDSAVEEAVFLTKFASKVYLIHRRDQLRAVPNIQNKALSNEKIEIIYNTVIEEIKGDRQVSSLSLLNKISNQTSILEVSAVFIYVGSLPNNKLLLPHAEFIKFDSNGFVITDEDMKTSIPGLYVAGDLRSKTLRQVVTATADGAIAAFLAEKFVV
jgi:thioredoxin reductase (NADPH)